ncbi:TetR/AcrR family transcriptional regulator [Methylocapsa palsarum]|uniref:DNA-binding transcriptional regulator, AcrR family n=1 Tax=Methylocapsa palsarum TaxID=1612308 RepID=A0A1I4D769_9HYPH|nr:TetR family transcriptional regulator [Methylocapsa palsarum]SFK88843.1 DNA-binding transcriptional regulator, AcrR family [Methylocapsa palsarum]
MASATLVKRDMSTRIIDVAEHLFGELGFRKTTVFDIARELKMSPANIYRFFDSKADINLAVARRQLAEIEALVEQIAGSFGSASDRLRRSIAAICNFHTHQSECRPKLHDLLVTAYDERWEVVPSHTETIGSSLVRIIGLGMSEGEFTIGEADLAAMLVQSACMQFCHPRLITEAAQGPSPLIDQMFALCLAGLTKNATVFVALERAPNDLNRIGISEIG